MLIQLFFSFFKIGLFCFGGGYAVLSFLQLEVVQQGWMSQERFVDMVAIAQSTPGAIAINVATFAGYEIGGVAGALVATLALILPGMIMMQLFALFLFHFYEHPRARSIFCGLRPAVVGLIATAAWQIALVTIWSRESCGGGCPLGLIEWRAVVICLVSVILIVRWRLHPGWLVLGAAVAGMLLF